MEGEHHQCTVDVEWDDHANFNNDGLPKHLDALEVAWLACGDSSASGSRHRHTLRGISVVHMPCGISVLVQLTLLDQLIQCYASPPIIITGSLPRGHTATCSTDNCRDCPQKQRTPVPSDSNERIRLPSLTWRRQCNARTNSV